MWLINVQTLQLEEHFNPDVPFAILSHTWGAEEVSFQEFKALDESLWAKAGFSKIIETCRLAKSLELPYAWIDTCCINKTSSAELSEAINSMFRWYQSSSICFAYLADLHDEDHSDTFLENFKASRWFTRGWTLQELIAPSMVTFYNASWKLLGSKQTLAGTLTSITGIDGTVLEKKVSLRKIPVGTRMSWASNRQTTRVEDLAYCLLGIFDINMPLLYGEGEKAFARLQSEIMQETNDLSLLAWTSETTDPERQQAYSGVFATSPSEFAVCSNLKVTNSPQLLDEAEVVVKRTSLQIVAILYIQKHAADEADTLDEREYVLSLQCSDERGTPPTRSVIGIYISKTPSGFLRHRPWRLSIRSANTLWPHDRKARSLKLLRQISTEDSWNIQDTRFQRAVFIRLDMKKTSFRARLGAGEASSAIPDALWDGLNTVFLDRNYEEFPFAPRLIQINLLYNMMGPPVGRLLLVSLMVSQVPSKAPERWAILLSYQQDPLGAHLLSQLEGWDTTSVLNHSLYTTVQSTMVKWQWQSDGSNESMPWADPAEGVATPKSPTSRTLEICRGRRVIATVSILSNDAGRGAYDVLVVLQDLK
ncbi:het domain protein [Colletotrichum truncatum]|uniref:Het domain protein n=1 Tax=Colletotrichum truncatum TaxID=5467 RepID=A0ACC3ZFD8_COLTU|nr:het domain protein [Colletotrichum truncatum]KAF6801702.1 het domain protein [Colletotrichum truncatum]